MTSVRQSSPTPEQIEQARSLLAQDYSWNDIEKMVGRRAETLRRHLDPEYRKKRNAASRRKQEGRSSGRIEKDAVRYNRAPDHLIADRDRRAAHDRTIGQMMLGDPLPGQSALDQLKKN
jgi:hypothetical protein